MSLLGRLATPVVMCLGRVLRTRSVRSVSPSRRHVGGLVDVLVGARPVDDGSRRRRVPSARRGGRRPLRVRSCRRVPRGEPLPLGRFVGPLSRDYAPAPGTTRSTETTGVLDDGGPPVVGDVCVVGHGGIPPDDTSSDASRVRSPKGLFSPVIWSKERCRTPASTSDPEPRPHGSV